MRNRQKRQKTERSTAIGRGSPILTTDLNPQVEQKQDPAIDLNLINKTQAPIVIDLNPTTTTLVNLNPTTATTANLKIKKKKKATTTVREGQERRDYLRGRRQKIEERKKKRERGMREKREFFIYLFLFLFLNFFYNLLLLQHVLRGKFRCS